MDNKRWIVYLVMGVLFYVILFFLYFRAVRVERNNQFNGVIQTIIYSEKGILKVIIKGEAYVIDFPDEDFKRKIELGDSLIKEANSTIYKLVKYKSGEVFVSN